ncbi:MAG TPA: hypothetical protein ENK75_00155, partial [Saprospiraceae bacterium]|nr:hypothetical protein [Saprospiraceae bacterium]
MIEKYTKLGMSVFENVVKEMPELEANRESVREFIVRMAFGHLNIVTRYGNTREIDLIFIDEVLKFYEASMKIPHDMAELFVVDTYNKMGSTSDFEDGERLVMYPAFAYADRSGVLAHLPT